MESSSWRRIKGARPPRRTSGRRCQHPQPPPAPRQLRPAATPSHSPRTTKTTTYSQTTMTTMTAWVLRQGGLQRHPLLRQDPPLHTLLLHSPPCTDKCLPTSTGANTCTPPSRASTPPLQPLHPTGTSSSNSNTFLTASSSTHRNFPTRPVHHLQGQELERLQKPHFWGPLQVPWAAPLVQRFSPPSTTTPPLQAKGFRLPKPTQACLMGINRQATPPNRRATPLSRRDTPRSRTRLPHQPHLLLVQAFHHRRQRRHKPPPARCFPHSALPHPPLHHLPPMWLPQKWWPHLWGEACCMACSHPAQRLPTRWPRAAEGGAVLGGGGIHHTLHRRCLWCMPLRLSSM